MRKKIYKIHKERLVGEDLLRAILKGKESEAIGLAERMGEAAAKGTLQAGGWTAGHLAAREGLEALLRALLAMGADPMARVSGGWTMGHLAAGNGNAGCVRALLEAGWDMDSVNHRGQTAEHLAQEDGSQDCRECEEALAAARRSREERLVLRLMGGEGAEEEKAEPGRAGKRRRI